MGETTKGRKTMNNIFDTIMGWIIVPAFLVIVVWAPIEILKEDEKYHTEQQRITNAIIGKSVMRENVKWTVFGPLNGNQVRLVSDTDVVQEVDADIVEFLINKQNVEKQ